MSEFCIGPFLEGCATSGCLIVTIGARNAFVLKQSLMKNYVFLTALICFLSYIFLVTLSVNSFSTLIAPYHLLIEIVRWGGVTFLLWYGWNSFQSAFKTNLLIIDQTSTERPSLKMTILTLMVVSFLNPHVYLDTVVLLGSIGAQFKSSERPFFILGAVSVSFVWFFGLSYGARYLAPLFSKPMPWKVLNFVIGMIMWGIASSLILYPVAVP